MTVGRPVVVALTILMCVMGGCAEDDPGRAPTAASPAPSPGSADVGRTPPGSDLLVLAQGGTENGIEWNLNLQPGDPVCIQLRRTNGAGHFMVCDESSEQDFSGDERLRYAIGGLNEEQVPKFVIGVTDPQVARVVINLPEGPSPEAETVSSLQAPGRRFFVVELDPEPAQHILAVRGLDAEGRTVAGFRFPEPGEGDQPSPLPTG